jgi:hypothetical protein
LNDLVPSLIRRPSIRSLCYPSHVDRVLSRWPERDALLSQTDRTRIYMLDR